MPRLANNRGNNNDDTYFTLLNKVMKIYFLLLFPASIGLLCVSKQVMWIFGAKYIPWYPVMIGFSIYMLTIGVQGIISNQIIYLYKKEREDVKIFFICGVFNVVGNFILILLNVFTPANSIMVTMISNVFVILLEYRVVRTKLNLDIKLFAFENMRYFYYSLLFIPITFVINKYIGNIIISCILAVAVCGLLYLGILMVTKDRVFFEIYYRCNMKFKALLGNRSQK